ncbi:putative secreted protein with PEP-CTERM sorting signal [Nitrosomonas sp. Nm84]|uniref:SGNH/GDSL hydrolase family protein n=1 Tax=Nitrosomonas sp. Nm84 TaxID=200124 RepID=UPI000D753BB9|nr:SGNH/GDSL hydrolase family protein [Nitrosomonas sp. Nm84]PXW81492.1 putative secreted protein with PEP-CTERM sorting signal [Nitrosomonas sp. Nm84]
MNYFGKFVVAAILIGLTASASARNYSGLYIFGDSLSDSGNIALAIGTDPGQIITDNSYIPSKPYASGQFTDGDVWATAFANAIGLAPFVQPALAGGGNFAFGGARVSTDGLDLPPSLITQSGLFLQNTGGAAPHDALYVVQGGGNDARDALTAIASGADATAVIDTAAVAYAQSINTLVDQLQIAGAERIVVWNVPNLGLTPAIVSQGLQASVLGTQVAVAMNNALADRLANENGVTIFDDFSLVTAAAMNPADYGLTNVTDACGAVLACDPSTYLFWDGIHPTSAGHALLAQQMIQAIPEPATYALLIAGLLVISMQIRRHT